MKKIYLFLSFVIFAIRVSSQDIAIQEVLYNEGVGFDKFELINQTGNTINISTWWMCARFGYRQFNNPSQIEVLEGNLNMPPFSTIKMRLLNLDLDDNHSDFGIFSDANFGSVTSMIDFIQWGNGQDVGRGYVAVAKGIWRDLGGGELDFIETASNGFSTNWDGDNEGGGELTFSSDFINDVPTLPIRLLTLNGRVNLEKNVELKWVALDEFTSEKHLIEKSIDGQVYSSIGEYSAQNLGIIPGQYSYVDDKPLMNAFNYYRIRQIDLDGAEHLSSPLYLKVKDVENKKIFISPMPISGIGCFSMELYWPRANPLTNFRIIDMTGKVVDSFTEPVLEGYNNVMHQFYGIEPGQYMMVISDNDGAYCAQNFLIGKQ